ncbi:Hypothetical predicted protein [Paramuricea clavata]|uniref:Uncharacterized protein n=1 Tax=Paramuricea clavata TaxID=317549 RepID=A0A7D9DJ68_PARCT|nr:Hypothetical predicted protein [Paramuricea clavata]
MDNELTVTEDAKLSKNEKRKLSNRKAVKKYRAKMTATAVDFKKKESKRVEACRKKRVNNMSAEEKSEYKRKAAERKRTSRQKKSENSTGTSASSPPSTSTSTPTSTPQNPYKRPQSFGKTIRKSLRSLPASPNKRRCVVEGLAKRIGLALDEEMCAAVGPCGRPAVSDDVVASVTQFFYRPDISYTMPGMKDEMTVWEQGQKTKLRKYYLVLFLREAYQVYIESFAGDEHHVKFSKF